MSEEKKNGSQKADTWPALLDKYTERAGTAGLILFAIFAFVWFFGDKPTQDLFLRSVLFGESHYYLPIGIGILVVCVFANIQEKLGLCRACERELERVTLERTRLQQELIGRNLPLISDGEER